MARGDTGFIFDPFGQAAPTYEELQRRRAIAQQLMMRQGKVPKTVGEGLTELGNAIGDIGYNWRVKQQEKEAKDKTKELVDKAPAEEPSTPRPYEPDAPEPTPREVSAVPAPVVAPVAAVPANPLTEAARAPVVTENTVAREPTPYTDAAVTAMIGPSAAYRPPTASPQAIVQGPNDARTEGFRGNVGVSTVNPRAVELGQSLPPSPEFPGASRAAPWFGDQVAAYDAMQPQQMAAAPPPVAGTRVRIPTGPPEAEPPPPPPQMSGRAEIAPVSPSEQAAEARFSDVMGNRFSAQNARTGATASLGRTGDVASDADPSQSGAAVADTVQQRREALRDAASRALMEQQAPPAPEVPQGPPTQGSLRSPTSTPLSSTAGAGSPDPRLAQASVFPNVSSDARPVLPPGTITAPPPAPVAAAKPAISKAPEGDIELPRLGPRPKPPSLLPETNSRVQYLEGVAMSPYADPTTRQKAQHDADKTREQIRRTNDQTILEYNAYLKQWMDQKGKREDPQTVIAVEKARRDLIGEGYRPATAEEAKALMPLGGKMPEGQAIWFNKRGEPKFGPAPTNTTVNVDTKGATEEAKIRGKLAAERENEVITAGNKAGEELTTISRAEALLEKIKTGALEPKRTTIAALGKSIGVSDDFMRSIGLRPEEVGSRQAFQAIVNELTLGRIGPGGMPSNNFSEGDRKFLERTEISLGDDDESNRIKLAAARKKRELQVERTDRWGDFREANPDKSFAEFERTWLKELKSRNEFGELNKRAEQLIENAKAGPHQGGIPGDLPANTPVNKIVTDGEAAFRRLPDKDGKPQWERLR